MNILLLKKAFQGFDLHEDIAHTSISRNSPDTLMWWWRMRYLYSGFQIECNVVATHSVDFPWKFLRYQSVRKLNWMSKFWKGGSAYVVDTKSFFLPLMLQKTSHSIHKMNLVWSIETQTGKKKAKRKYVKSLMWHVQ